MSDLTRILFLLTSGMLLNTAVAPRHVIAADAWVQALPLEVPSAGKPGFSLLSPDQTGVRFTNTVGEWEAAANRVLLDGSGVALGDFDNDNRPDIFLCSLSGRNTLFKNLGNWQFTDVTESAGLPRDPRPCRGAVFADLNGDDALDLLVSVVGGGVECFLNNARGGFTSATSAARTATLFGSMTLALADVDGNGTLDLYVANNRAEDIRDRGQANLRVVNGQMVVPPELRQRLTVINGQVLEFGEPDQLYLNDGRGRFTPVSWTGGRFRTEEGQPLTAPPLDWGLTATFRDLNADGLPDLYVCNDFWTPDRVWLNDGKGRFQAAPRLAFRNMCASSMGVDFADIDRDGFVDAFVVDMLSRDPRLRKRQKPAQVPMPSVVGLIDDRPQVMRNTLYQNRGDGTFAELAHYAGVTASEWSWSPVFLDVDLDGWEDLLITSGHAKDVQDLDAQAQIRSRQHSWTGFASEAERQKAYTQELLEHMRLYPRLDTPIIAYRNRGNFQFEEVTTRWGTDQPGVHHGIATGDLDGDGDLDLVVNKLGSAAGVYRNDSPSARVAVRLKGKSPNTQGIGAQVRLRGASVPLQSQEMIAGGRYLSGSDASLVFAPGNATNGMSLEVAWRSGRRTRLDPVEANRLYVIKEPETPAPSPAVPPAASKPLLAESNQLEHRHHEEAFDDFARQPLLPFKLSQAGPGLAWQDLDADGRAELMVGSGRGGRIAAFFVGTNGAFTAVPSGDDAVMAGDTTGMAGWTTASGRRVLLVGVSAYEDSAAPAVVQGEFSQGRLSFTNLLAGDGAGAGALAVADIDADGDLDLFVGGQVRPGRYPESSPGRIYRCAGERLELDAPNTKAIADAGPVNGAVWSDLNADGYPELVLACEWGPVRVFSNQSGKLTESTSALGLAAHTGWWKGVTTGDLDGDGRMDIVAANWGLNDAYRASTDRPLRLYHGDLADRGMVELIETEFDPVGRATTPRRSLDALAAAMPYLREQFPTHLSFSQASVDAVLGERRSRARTVEITTLETTLFLNRGDRFAAMPLPREAQEAPAFAVHVADLDGDGAEDIFLGQNFFATQPESSRLDAGRGLWLRGNGDGRLTAVSGARSGIRIYGEQRGAALGDADRDGRIDLVVSQNGAPTRFLKNQEARPGLRIRLKGPAGNPEGVGAMIRVQFGERWGPAREVHGGSGWFSQDDLTTVMAAPQPPNKVAVTWPGGAQTTATLAKDASEILVRIEDAAR